MPPRRSAAPPGDLHVLLPGAVDVARPDGLRQVGHDTAAVVLPDAAPVRALLGSLTTDGASPPRPESPAEVWRAWQRLHEADLLVPATAVRVAREVVRGSPLDGPAADAALLRHGTEAPHALRDRLGARVVLHAPVELLDPARSALRAAGLVISTAAPGAGSRDAPGVVHLVLADVRCDAEVVDRLVQEGRPHLPVVRDPSGVLVGPFVLPGTTACLGCLEATRADRDPDQGLVRLLRARAMRDRRMPGDPALLLPALALAARELATWASGAEPSTWSSTWWLGADGRDHREPLARHPRCGCAWDALLLPAG